MTTKRRNINYSPEVLSAVQQDELLKGQAKEIREISDQKNAPPFEVALYVFDCYKAWKEKNTEWGFNFYLFNLIKVGKLKSKQSSLKLSYKVISCFPDLRTPDSRKMPFDCYREIANTKLTQDQMNELRQDAEEHNYSGRKIRERVRKFLGQDKEDSKPKENPYEKIIIYKNDDQFLQVVKDVLQGPQHPVDGTVFRLKRSRS